MRGQRSGAHDLPATRSRTWALVLAAGRGTRLEALTRRGEESIPKQYCALKGTTTMLDWALVRARAITGQGRVAAIVAAEHRKWWRHRLGGVWGIVQPADRGTAAGILLPVLSIRRRDPEATVLVLPADHYVAEEPVFRVAMRRALAQAEAEPERLILIGTRPERPEPGVGWVVPARPGRAPSVGAVERFREKPDAEEARRLAGGGALVNTFVFAARAGALVDLYRRHLPEVLGIFEQEDWASQRDLAACYARLPVRDFSRDLLERAVSRLSVVEASPCGWSDLGTPERVARCVEEIERRPDPMPRSNGSVRPPLELARRLVEAGRF
jgi:mannose-1-phosphate guanylyltransferase